MKRKQRQPRLFFFCDCGQAKCTSQRTYAAHLIAAHGYKPTEAKAVARTTEKRASRHYQFVAQYLRAMRAGFKVLKAGGRVRLRWGDNPMDLAAFRREFVTALHRRISHKAAPDPAWRKLSPEYQIALARDARAVANANRRIRVYQFETAEARQRFGHLLADRTD